MIIIIMIKKYYLMVIEFTTIHSLMLLLSFLIETEIIHYMQ